MQRNTDINNHLYFQPIHQVIQLQSQPFFTPDNSKFIHFLGLYLDCGRVQTAVIQRTNFVIFKYLTVTDRKICYINVSTIPDGEQILSYPGTSRYMLLNCRFISGGRYLATADRDEKIRITRYPDTYDIQVTCDMDQLQYPDKLKQLREIFTSCFPLRNKYGLNRENPQTSTTNLNTADCFYR